MQRGVFTMPSDSDILSALRGLGKFTILDENREGANAYAFRAFHDHLERDVFLKVFYLGTEETELTLREPRLLTQATQSNGCTNIVRVFDGDVFKIGDDDYVCLQMEYVEGGSLLARMQASEIGQQDAVRIATQVLQGVHQLHHLRFVHRDLKPANILISSDGVAKITDFGSVARIPDAVDYCTASRHSILYVPPEAMGGRYRFSSDLYQVGMVLYEMVNGPMNYSYAHYVLPKAQRQLNRDGTPYDQLDGFEQSRLNRECIKALADKESLLSHGREPVPYFSQRLRRLIKSATNPDLAQRFGTALEFHSKLLQINLPNWKTADDRFEASDWQGWDWRASLRPRRIGAEPVLERARVGSGSFRRVANQTFASLSDVFGYVENFQS